MMMRTTAIVLTLLMLSACVSTPTPPAHIHIQKSGIPPALLATLENQVARYGNNIAPLSIQKLYFTQLPIAETTTTPIREMLLTGTIIYAPKGQDSKLLAKQSLIQFQTDNLLNLDKRSLKAKRDMIKSLLLALTHQTP